MPHNGGANCRGIGVTTNPNIRSSYWCTCNGHYWSNGLTYIWDGMCGTVHRFNKFKQEEKYKSNTGRWTKGMTVTIAIDCENWKLVIWKGDDHLITINMVKNKTYHPVLSCDNKWGCDFTLIASS